MAPDGGALSMLGEGGTAAQDRAQEDSSPVGSSEALPADKQSPGESSDEKKGSGQSEAKKTSRKRDGPSQATRLVQLASDLEYFHSPAGEAFATVAWRDHSETWPLRSRQLRLFLQRRFHLGYKQTPSMLAMQDALAVLEGRALYSAPEHPVFLRLAEHSGEIYIDLANESWEAIRVTSSGWGVVKDPPVKFRRARSMASLPHPAPSGDISELRPFVNIASEDDWRMLVNYLLAAMRPHGPYPVGILHGEQGSAKSTTARVLRALVDPNETALRAEPRDVRDVMIGATNAWMLAFDNVSHLPHWLSDALCRLSTGGGFATRELYTDADEILFNAQRPVLLNGIEDLATRGDLADRSLLFYLPAIPDDRRRPESDFWRDFQDARPRILAGLLKALCAGIRNVGDIPRDRLPRMADFAIWGMAVSGPLGWSREEFLASYTANRERSLELALEESPLVEPLRRIVADGDWEGTASALLDHVGMLLDLSPTRVRGRPGNARALSSALRRLAPSLRQEGIEIEFRRRWIVIRKAPESCVGSVSVADASSPVTTQDAADASTAGISQIGLSLEVGADWDIVEGAQNRIPPGDDEGGQEP